MAGCVDHPTRNGPAAPGSRQRGRAVTVDDPRDPVGIVSIGAPDEVSVDADLVRDEAGIRAQLAAERRANARLRRLTAAATALSGAATPMQVAEVAVEQFGRMF